MATAAALIACRPVGLWPPLGLIEDLVTVTGPDGTQGHLHDGRLRALADHPGVRRLRELGWPVRARTAFSALLASHLTPDPVYAPPESATGPQLRDAMVAALGSPRSPAVPTGIRLDELRAALDNVTPRTITLLAIIGPGAAAADPVLPLRLSHQIPQLPVLSGRPLQLLGGATPSRRTGHRPSGGSMRHSPGTAGVNRNGTPTQLLPTQLALPSDLFTARYLRDQLLYRRHLGEVPPSPRPVTLILDTTPPAHGPAEQVLRLVAHLVTITLWQYGEHPMLISLTRPEIVLPLTDRRHLVHLWATRTLDPPGPALATALDTARTTPHPFVLLAHHHTPKPSYLPGPRQQLVTTHHPPEPQPLPPTRPDHHHLPPEPTEAQLDHVVQSVLTSTWPGQ